MGREVFINYSSEDKMLVDAVCLSLEKSNFSYRIGILNGRYDHDKSWSSIICLHRSVDE